LEDILCCLKARWVVFHRDSFLGKLKLRLTSKLVKPFVCWTDSLTGLDLKSSKSKTNDVHSLIENYAKRSSRECAVTPLIASCYGSLS
jgi:hypothetical protein